MKKKVIITAVVAVVIAVTVTAAIKSRGEKPLTVQTAAASRQTVIQKVNATGKIEPRTQVKISADVSARIMRIGVKEGDRVEKGQFLVELDREAYVAAVDSAEANLRSAEANARLVKESMLQAQRDFDRAREIVKRKLDSQSRLDAAEAAYKIEAARHEAALGDVAKARAAVKQARDSLSKTTIYAPIDGVITELRRKQGEIAIGSQFQEDVILVISSMSVMEAQLDVDENDIVSIKLGDPAEIQVDALRGKLLKGKVYEIASSATSNVINGQAQGQAQNQKTDFLVKVAIEEPPAELRPGMTASADIVTDTRPSALSVPLQCVTVRTMEQLQAEKTGSAATGPFKPDRDGFVQLVFVLEDGKAVARQVETGIQSDSLIEVTGGLKEGETVVSGSYRAISRDLKNGSPVTVDNHPAKAEKA